MRDSTISVYNTIASDYALAFKEKPEEREIIFKFIKSLPTNPKILDIGCGTSDYFYLFQAHGVEYTGIDLSVEMIKIARKMNPGGKFLVQDMREIDFHEKTFDGVYCFYSLIHLSDVEIQKILKKINYSSRETGKLLIGLQEGKGEVYKKSPFSNKGEMYLNLFTQESITIFLNEAGYKVDVVEISTEIDKNKLPYRKMMILASKQQHIS